MRKRELEMALRAANAQIALQAKTIQELSELVDASLKVNSERILQLEIELVRLEAIARATL